MVLTAACFGRDLERDGWPTVSVVMPIRNEAEGLERAVASVLAQAYPLPFDVCLAVGPSHDGTESIATALAARERRVHVAPNPSGDIPSALNIAIRATTGDVVVRIDGHTSLPPDYIGQAVTTMCRTGAVNVGGMQVPDPQTSFEDAVASAITSALGTGGATYRYGGAAGPVDTVYLGVFDRRAGEVVGWYDEELLSNEDYELNIRLRKAGGVVWFDPQLRVGYRPRGSLGAVLRQYFRYGRWKAEVARRHPDSLRLRQLAPAALLPVLLAASFTRRGRLGLIMPYAIAVSTTALRRPAKPAVPAVIAAMHLAWSAGFCTGVAGLLRRSVAGRASSASTPNATRSASGPPAPSNR